jgi:6,7-dimethyl-8-ribityllumazine synthase
MGLPDGVETIEGSLDASGLRFAVVVARFNDFITERLLEGAVDTLLRSGAAAEDVKVVRVPGSWELPQAAAMLVAPDTAIEVDAVLALGCLIRGETIHFDLIAAEAAKGLSKAGLDSGIPVVFGVLTTETLDQAINRAGGKSGNKGSEVAAAAIEQARLHRRLRSSQ